MYLGSGDNEHEWMESTYSSYLTIFDCFRPRRKASATQHERRKSILGFGVVERQMGAMDQQPHLVAPMKLTVFDKLPPPTPPAAGPSGFQWVTQTKNLASRASSRASSRTQRKPVSQPVRRPTVSDSQPVIRRRPVGGRAQFRPLELSIYLPSNRLSDLPEFERFTFTEGGEIQFPPKARLRATSEQILPAPAVVETGPPKSASMIERRMPQMGRPATHSASSSRATRSQSEYNPLHSHPVSWSSQPGLPPQIAMATERKNAPLPQPYAMYEEASPARPATAGAEMRSSTRPFGFGISGRASQETVRQSSESDQAPTGFHASSYQSQKRVSQWLGHRANVSSISTVKTTMSAPPATLSFAEHRRRRAQFYKLSANYVPPPPKPFGPAPRYGGHDQSRHQRSMTISTMQSSLDATDRGSLLEDDESRYEDFDDEDDMESMTTGATASEIQSRTGTIRSVRTTTGVRQPVLPIIVSDSIPEVPSYGAGGNKGADSGVPVPAAVPGGVVVPEIKGVLQVPIGIAF